ncbi:sulfotransferase family protein, partial [Aspergillus aculeatinus CBS 121060]
NVSCNIRGTLVAADLIKAYPEAKVVVSTREVDRWLRSMRQSVDSAVSWKSFDWLAPWDPYVIGRWWKYHKFQHGLRPLIAPQGERQAYLDYYAWIQHAVPAERLLMFNPRDGWGPLCEFLGVPVPDVPFPHVNNTEQFLAGRRRRWWRTVGFMLAKLSTPVLAVVA